MIDDAVAVVEGTVSETAPGLVVPDEEGGVGYTNVIISVDQVFSGDVTTDTIVLEEMTHLDGELVEVNGLDHLKEGDSGFFFLRRKDDGNYGLLGFQARLLKSGSEIADTVREDPLSRRLEAMTAAQLRAHINEHKP